MTDTAINAQATPPTMTVPKLPRIRLGRIATHVSLLFLVILWTLPTAGLLISSIRDADQLSVSGWWTALSPTIVQEAKRLPRADEQVQEDGRFVLRGNLFDGDSNRTIQTYGATNATLDEAPAGEPLEMPSGGVITVQADGAYLWTSETEFIYTRGPRIYLVAELQPTATLENYTTVLTSNGVGRSFLNSMTVAIPATIIPIVVAAFAAYALAWMRFPGRTLLVVAVVALLVVPLQMSLIPVLRLYNDIASVFGVEGKGYFGVWFAHTAFGLPLAIYLLRNYMAGLPREIMESARIDGASHFRTFTTMVLPLSFPALASIAIFQFLWIWNDLLVALVFLGSQDDQIVLTGRLINLLGAYGDSWHLLTAGAFISIVVPLIVFVSLQRYFVRGLLAGSVK